MVFSEARMVRERNSNRRKRDTSITQLVLSRLFGKRAGKELTKTLNKVAESD